MAIQVSARFGPLACALSAQLFVRVVFGLMDMGHWGGPTVIAADVCSRRNRFVERISFGLRSNSLRGAIGLEPSLACVTPGQLQARLGLTSAATTYAGVLATGSTRARDFQPDSACGDPCSQFQDDTPGRRLHISGASVAAAAL